MRRTVPLSLMMAAAGALVAWRGRKALAPHWKSFRTFSVPSARLYDALSFRFLTGMYSRIARDIADAHELRGSVLDVGCGPGRLALEIIERSPDVEVTGVDVSSEMVALAASNALARGIGGRAVFKVGDASSLPCPDGSFDLVVSSLSLHHWPDAAQGLREIHRVLKPGGRVVIYDVANWLMHVERQGLWLDDLADASPFSVYSLEPVWGVWRVSLLWRLTLTTTPRLSLMARPPRM